MKQIGGKQTGRCICAILVAAPAALLSGCVSGDGAVKGPIHTPPAGAVVASPFSPAGMRLLPLSHFEVTPDGEPRVLVFFELLDQWGDTVKGAGGLELRVRAGDDSAEWEIDLSDLERNASLYDPSTRAYRLALSDLPGWLGAIGRGDSGVAGSVELGAFFRTIGSDGSSVVLRDRLSIRGPR